VLEDINRKTNGITVARKAIENINHETNDTTVAISASQLPIPAEV